ncbi:hypothetical protein PIB30_059659 [Stylosanthes scabra]|uniref:GDSL esterase/lipase n=1 Tax=Stylosanthes scabra TaxID=79078 RepID=A0ABU6TK40_9FABA|nr:hypothetical protein [Stylosanthes scabra]
MPLKECCVANLGSECGDVNEKGRPLYKVCGFPDLYFFWDAVHPSQAGWSAIFPLLKPAMLGERIRPPSRSSAVLLAVAVNLRPSSLTPHVAEPSTERELGERESERELGERIRPPSRSSAVLFAVVVNLHPSSPSYSLSCLIAVAPDLGRPLRLRHFCRSNRRSEKRDRESKVNGSVAVNLPRRASTVQISQADHSVKQP